MNILITGGLGYIGSSLIESLKGHNIAVVDNLYAQRYCSLYNRKSHFTFIEEDFAHLSIEWLKQFDYIIHLAAIIDILNTNEQKSILHKVNTIDTIAFLYHCNQARVKVIFPSSTSVYGTATDIVYEDDKSVLQPQSAYAESKIEVENVLHKIMELDYTVLRFGTISGVSPGIHFKTCVNKFCYQAVFKQPLTVWKQNLNLYRPYLSLVDVQRIILFILSNDWNLFNKQTFNILTQNSSLNTIIANILLYEPSTTINYTDCPLLNQFSYEVSTDKIKRLGFQFTGNINTDIQQTICLLRNKNENS